MSTVEMAQTVMARCETLGEFSEEAECVTRRFATPAMRQVNETVAGWMRAAGMAVREDAVGNVIGRYEAQPTAASARTLLLGSHLDSVRDAGKYDGPLGVLLAIACVQRLHDRQERLPFALEVFGFADEEGLRYHSAYLGSKAVAGMFDTALLSQADADGITMAEAIRAHGGDPEAIATARRAADDLIGYCEVHIEQGPVLEARDLPLGVVSAIAGQSRISVRYTGVAGHAGTVPMAQRHDALCAASAFILAVEQIAGSLPGVVATVGQIEARPGASNVIPGDVTLSLDVRHAEDAQRLLACERLEVEARRIAEARGVSVAWAPLQVNAAVQCDPELRAVFEQAVESLGYPVLLLPSGAGHDAAAMADLTRVAMLFVRCKAGISHSPAESVAAGDVAVAIEALEQFLTFLAEQQAFQ